jgi:flavodoxin
VTKGPYAKGDPALGAFGITNDDKKADTLIYKYKDFISKSENRYLITFMGKKYGPFDQIDQFIATKSKEKFVASVTEKSVNYEDPNSKMEKDLQNAKTDEERMKIAMKAAQEQIADIKKSDIIKKGINPAEGSPYISNIPDFSFNPLKTPQLELNGDIKFDEILLCSSDKIMDLKGNLIMTWPQPASNFKNFFISSDNSRWAGYIYGTITLNDKSTLPDTFNVRLIKVDGKVYLAYMYYSPKRNSIMQCKIPF